MRHSEKCTFVPEIARSRVLSFLLLSPPKFLIKPSYGKSHKKICRIQAEELETQQIIYLSGGGNCERSEKTIG